MIDYQKKHRFKIFLIKLLDFLTVKNKTIYASLYLDKDEEPKMVILQSSFDSMGKYGWIFTTTVNSTFFDKSSEYYIFYKHVGYFEWRYFTKKSTAHILEYVGSLNNIVNALKAANKSKDSKNSKKDVFNNLKLNKNKILKNMFEEKDEEN
jgi:hypothetical protein